MNNSSTIRILEIGGGATGLVNQIEWGTRMETTPWRAFCREEFGTVINPAVLLAGGRAETLPYPEPLS